MRKRILSLRVTETEYQALKARADAGGVSVQAETRRAALEAIELGPRLAAIEARLAELPTGPALAKAFERLALKIGKGGAA